MKVKEKKQFTNVEDTVRNYKKQIKVLQKELHQTKSQVQSMDIFHKKMHYNMEAKMKEKDDHIVLKTIKFKNIFKLCKTPKTIVATC